jgi:hypothetical protein
MNRELAEASMTINGICAIVPKITQKPKTLLLSSGKSNTLTTGEGINKCRIQIAVSQAASKRINGQDGGRDFCDFRNCLRLVTLRKCSKAWCESEKSSGWIMAKDCMMSLHCGQAAAT